MSKISPILHQIIEPDLPSHLQHLPPTPRSNTRRHLMPPSRPKNDQRHQGWDSDAYAKIQPSLSPTHKAADSIGETMTQTLAWTLQRPDPSLGATSNQKQVPQTMSTQVGGRALGGCKVDPKSRHHQLCRRHTKPTLHSMTPWRGPCLGPAQRQAPIWVPCLDPKQTPPNDVPRQLGDILWGV